jgi:hypothetical protein
MDSQERDKTENETAFRIRRIREAFTEARNKAALKDNVATPKTENELKSFDNSQISTISKISTIHPICRLSPISSTGRVVVCSKRP